MPTGSLIKNICKSFSVDNAGKSESFEVQLLFLTWKPSLLCNNFEDLDNNVIFMKGQADCTALLSVTVKIHPRAVPIV